LSFFSKFTFTILLFSLVLQVSFCYFLLKLTLAYITINLLDHLKSTYVLYIVFSDASFRNFELSFHQLIPLQYYIRLPVHEQHGHLEYLYQYILSPLSTERGRRLACQRLITFRVHTGTAANLRALAQSIVHAAEYKESHPIEE